MAPISDLSFLKRQVQSEVNRNTARRETVDTEDWLRTQQWLREQKDRRTMPPPPPPQNEAVPHRDALLRFANSQSDSGWAAARDDPAVRDALKVVRERVKTIAAESREYAAPHATSFGAKAINARAGGPRHKLFRTSTLHPLYLGQVSWNPEARPWPGRSTAASISLKKEPTSFWCESWGMSASDQPVDFEFKQRPRPPIPRHARDLHVRDWR